MARMKWLAIAAVLFLMFSANASAANPSMRVKPVEHDPGNACDVTAAWVAKAGLPDAGKSNHALIMGKACPTTIDAAAVAFVDGVEGLPADGVYGFHHKIDSYCGAGATRFYLVASDGPHHIGGCLHGTKVAKPGAPGWQRVTFDPQNPTQAYPVVTPGATIVALYLIHDEEGANAVLDNIFVGALEVGKPGNA